MTKEKMNEEELFCKLFPEYTVNGKPLSPYFDLFERGYEEAEDKMKCCGNCKYYQFQKDARYYTCIKDGKRNEKNYRSCEFLNLEKWELRG